MKTKQQHCAVLSQVHETWPKQTAVLILVVEHFTKLVVNFQTFCHVVIEGTGVSNGNNEGFHSSLAFEKVMILAAITTPGTLDLAHKQ